MNEDSKDVEIDTVKDEDKEREVGRDVECWESRIVVADAYDAYISSLHGGLALAKLTTGQSESNEFMHGAVIGASVGAAAATLAVFAMGKCNTGKADDFYRV